jgi:hypothetical protein
MRRIAIVFLTSLLAGCGTVNDKIIEYSRDRSPYNTVPAVTGLILATPPVNTILVNSCNEELFMDASKRKLCNLNHKIHGTTPPWERAAAEARLMSYQPGELQCSRTLGGVSDCRVISGIPRPVTLITTNMGSN